MFPTFKDIVAIDICQGESYFAGGAFQTETGIYQDVYTAIEGCDSIIVTDLTVHPVYETALEIEICNGECYMAEGILQTETGIYHDTLTSIYGCDSVIVTNLTVNPVYEITNNISICEGDSYLAKGIPQTETGIYYDTLTSINGCDSVIVTDLTVFPTYEIIQNIGICYGDSYMAEGIPQTETGIYYDTLTSINGCDSVIVTDLTVFPTYEIIQNIEICNGNSYMAEGILQTETGIYYDTLTSINGCDSVIITDLTVFPTYEIIQNIEICNGDSYIAEGIPQTETGIYYDTLTTINGCDSVIVTDLTVFATYEIIQKTGICNGESYMAEGIPQTETGIYYDTLTTINGCDSVIVTDLTVSPTYEIIQKTGICNGNSYIAEGIPQTETGIYYDTLTSINGCDSVIVTDLTAFPVYEITNNISICEGDSYLAEGIAQTATGTYYNSLKTINGCDSVIITNLMVNPSYIFVVDTIIDFNQSYIAGGEEQTETGTYYDSLTTINGCDSIIITNLTIGKTYLIYNSISLCNGESYFAEGISQTESGIYYDSLLTILGKDSIVVTTLTVNPTYYSINNISISDKESYIVKGKEQTETGVYTDSLKTILGCDSVIVTNLTVYPTYNFTKNVSICQGESYKAKGILQTEEGIYIDSLTTAYGYDSIITTNLTVNPLPEVSLGNDTSIYEKDILIIDAGVGYYIYEWNIGDDSRFIIIDDKYSVGDHELIVNIKDIITNCTNSDTIVINIKKTTGTGFENISHQNIKIYPNPATETLFLDLENIYGETTMNIYNQKGQLIRKELMETDGKLLKTKISISDLNPGIYIIQIINNNSILVNHKLIKKSQN